MNESEFRDWSRAAMRDLDERIKRLEARPQGELRPQVSSKLAAGMVQQAEALLKAVRGGGVTGMAIAYLGPDGPLDGWTSSGLEGHLALLGAVQQLNDDLLHPDAERVKILREQEAAA
jgi:hypothetical protein